MSHFASKYFELQTYGLKHIIWYSGKQQSISEYIIKIRLKKAYVFKIIIGSHAETHAEGKGK